jgi:hypothetical protein
VAFHEKSIHIHALIKKRQIYKKKNISIYHVKIAPNLKIKLDMKNILNYIRINCLTFINAAFAIIISALMKTPYIATTARK